MNVIYYVYGHLAPDGLEYVVRALHRTAGCPATVSDISVHQSMRKAEQVIKKLSDDAS